MKHPKILMLGKIREVNKYLLKKTGCFAFLLDDHLQWNYAEPQNGKEAFEIWSVALYVVYHDYGCYYLKYLLSDENIMTKGIEPEMRRARKHYQDIVNCFRGNFAHGILDEQSRDKMAELINRRYLKKTGHFKKLDIFMEDDWRTAAGQLRKQADELYETLLLWADKYYESKFREWLSAKQQFGKSDCFKKSICERVVFESLDKDLRERNRYAKEILDNREVGNNAHKNAADTLLEWQDIIQNDFLNDKLNTDQEIINKIKELLKEVYEPKTVSSIDIALECGYDLDNLLS